MIFLKNKQKKISINQNKLKHDAQEVLNFLKYRDFAVGVWLTTNETIHKFNKQYRNVDKPTDILSFPYHVATPGKRIKPKTDEDYYLGDIIISLEYAQRCAIEHDIPFEKHLLVLLIHGICHLLGYDHNTDAEHKKMQRLEKKILQSFSE